MADEIATVADGKSIHVGNGARPKHDPPPWVIVYGPGDRVPLPADEIARLNASGFLK